VSTKSASTYDNNCEARIILVRPDIPHQSSLVRLVFAWSGANKLGTCFTSDHRQVWLTLEDWASHAELWDGCSGECASGLCH
jgi:hypothetical protein